MNRVTEATRGSAQETPIARARARARELLDRTKRGVEVAIGQNENAALGRLDESIITRWGHEPFVVLAFLARRSLAKAAACL